MKIRADVLANDSSASALIALITRPAALLLRIPVQLPHFL